MTGLITGIETGVRLATVSSEVSESVSDSGVITVLGVNIVVDTGVNGAVTLSGALSCGSSIVVEVGINGATSVVISLLIGVGSVSSSSSTGPASGSVGGIILGETGDLAGTTIPSGVISGTLGSTTPWVGSGCTGTGAACTGAGAWASGLGSNDIGSAVSPRAGPVGGSGCLTTLCTGWTG